MSLCLNVDAFLNNIDIYDARLLKGPALWLSPPSGIGNEIPFAVPTAYGSSSKDKVEMYYNAKAKHLMLVNANVLRDITLSATIKHLEAVKRIYKQSG